MHNPTLIPGSVQLQIFQRSFPTKGPGHGLGTYSMKFISERYLNGQVYFESNAENGTTFFAEFPQTPSAKIPNETQRDATDQLSPSLRVLIVDDNTINRMIIKNIFETYGCCIDTAKNGAEAVEKGSKQPYDLILMDIQMPIMSGLDATRKLRKMELENRPVIIALTAGREKKEIDQSLDAGMDDHTTKPLELENLFSLLRKYRLIPSRSTRVRLSDRDLLRDPAPSLFYSVLTTNKSWFCQEFHPSCWGRVSSISP